MKPILITLAFGQIALSPSGLAIHKDIQMDFCTCKTNIHQKITTASFKTSNRDGFLAKDKFGFFMHGERVTAKELEEKSGIDQDDLKEMLKTFTVTAYSK